MDKKRLEPPHVHRGADGNHWIVEPPRGACPGQHKTIFSGEQAQQQALTYAHETFGNARFFPY